MTLTSSKDPGGYTPGRWKIRSANFVLVVETSDRGIATIQGPAADLETQANADLIATAPALLAALENLENDDGSIPDHSWQLVCAAIAKAKGAAR